MSETDAQEIQPAIKPRKKAPGWPKGKKRSKEFTIRGPVIALPFQNFKERLAYWAETKTVEQIEELITKPELWKPLPVIDAMCAKALHMACKESGEHLSRVLDRLIGKPAQAFLGDDGKTQIAQTDIDEIARRTAFLMAIAGKEPAKLVAPTIEQEKSKISQEIVPEKSTPPI